MVNHANSTSLGTENIFTSHEYARLDYDLSPTLCVKKYVRNDYVIKARTHVNMVYEHAKIFLNTL